MRRAKLLIVDDETMFHRSITQHLKNQNYEIFTAMSFDEARKILISETPQVVVLDMVLPDRSGMDLLSLVKQNHPLTEVIVITGFGSIESAVEATKKGAFAYLPKPFDPEIFTINLRNALQSSMLKTENTQLRDTLKKEYGFDNLVGTSAAIQNIFRTVEKIAKTDSTVLITGESGTGKELIAKAIHFHSLRSRHMFVPINCGAIPEDLLESELFGHVKGAFTGAISGRVGRFETAHKGTLFLDEIGDAPLSIQVKLLRVLQEKTFEYVGSNKPIEVDVRIIAATNQNLRELIGKKFFREDLYYRLNVIPIEVPPLRNRMEDIPALAKYFLVKYCKHQRKDLIEVDALAMQALCDYPWPGNVREFQNLIEQLTAFCDGRRISIHDLPKRFFQKDASQGVPSPQTTSASSSVFSFHIPSSGMDFNRVVDQIETNLIIEALQKTQWNKNQAAKLLNLNRTTLVEKMKKKNIGLGKSKQEISL
jgi:DNA-binding NtrC family response regulator